MFARIHSAWRGAAGDERGFTVPTVTLMLLAAIATVAVGVAASIHAQSGATRDNGTKLALATAEAGATQALLAYNGYNGVTPLSNAAPCLVPVSQETMGPAAAGPGGWCTAVTGSTGSGTYSYQVCPNTTLNACAGSGTIQVVSTGTSNGVTRRIMEVLKSASGQQVFLDAGVKSQTNIILDSNAAIHSNTWAGGSIITGSTSTQLCGTATVGTSGTLSGSGQYYSGSDCTGPLPFTSVGHKDLTLPPVNQGNAATSNDNCRITGAVLGVVQQGCSGKDLISGSPTDVVWDPVKRTLSLTGQKTALTLSGAVYSLCRLTLSQNSTLYIAPGTQTQIFFDSPEACGLAPWDPTNSTTQKNTAQLWAESNTRITSSNPAALNLGLYFVGSNTIPTGILMSSNTDSNAACVQNFVIYAPLTYVELNSNSTYCGAIAAKSIHLDQNAIFNTDSPSQQIILPNTPPHYALQKFVDCTAAPASPPSAGC